MDWSLSKVIRIETGGVGISTSDLRQLLQLYQVTDPAEVTELVELARIGRRRPWWTRFRDTMPAGYLSYIGLEDESSGLRYLSPGIPGLLQTEEYARAVVEGNHWLAWPRVGAVNAADQVEIRLTRQREVLQRANPPEITAILDEAVLWRQIGGPAVLRRQLLHLVALGSSSRITIQVLPFTASLINIMSHVVLLEFPDPADPDAVYVESAYEQSLLEGADVDAYRAAFAHIQEASLNEQESLALVARVAGEIS